MFKNSFKLLFFLILISSTMITVSSNSWLSAWMGLEINLLSFIPLMTNMNNNNLMSTEASLKYFLTQALASSILLFFIILLMLKTNIIFQLNFDNNFYYLIIMSTLLMKSGAAPFHFWFPKVMKGLSWMNAFILMTWQKIAPLMLISYMEFNMFIKMIILISILVGSLGGLNQTNLMMIMTFSSINHLGWLLAAMMSNESLWMTYFMIYSFLTMTLMFFFNIFKITHINQLFSMFFFSKPIKFLMLFNLLSLGGLPPFLGFLPKWLVIQFLTNNNQLMLMFMMTTMTLITLYFYMRMCYSAFMLNYYENNWNFKNYFNNFYMKIYFIMSFISISGLFSINLMWNFI